MRAGGPVSLPDSARPTGTGAEVIVLIGEAAEAAPAEVLVKLLAGASPLRRRACERAVRSRVAFTVLFVMRGVPVAAARDAHKRPWNARSRHPRSGRIKGLRAP